MHKSNLAKVASLAVFGVIAALFVACGGGDDDDGQANDGGTGGVREVTVATSSSQLVFTPSTIRVKAGQPVKLILDNSEGTVLHDWSIEEMHVSAVHTEGGAEHMMEGTPMNGTPMADEGMDGFALHIAADTGTEATIEFTPDEAGEYTFFCTVEGHRQAGMEGKLIVE